MANITLHPGQAQAVERLETGNVLTGGVGSGKSITSLAYYFTQVCGGDLSVNGEGWMYPFVRPHDLYIITTARKRDDQDWEMECARFGLNKDPSKSFSNTKVVIDSWNNITKYVGVTGAFFIFDEQRAVGKGAWAKTFIKICRNNKWIMLSATPGDNWMDYIPLFLANGFYRNKTEFIREHVIYAPYSKFPKIEKYVKEAKLRSLRSQIQVDIPMERHTKRHLSTIKVDYDKQLFERVLKDRWHVYEERPIRDVAELFICMRKVVNTDISRLKALDETFESKKKLIVFYNFNYELDILREHLSKNNITFSEWNGQKHEKLPTGDEWVYLVQYTAGAEGWNCIQTDTTVFYSLNYSYKIFEQAQGRIDRMNTPFTDLYYYILKSSSFIDSAIAKALSHKENFNIRDYVKRMENA